MVVRVFFFDKAFRIIKRVNNYCMSGGAVWQPVDAENLGKLSPA